MTAKPIRRNKNISALSRDHHFGLLFCWKVRQGIKKEIAPERIGAYAGYFWTSHLIGHFEEEETLLFDKVLDSQSEKARQQHGVLRLLFSKATEYEEIRAGYQVFSDLADALEAHIRFEERELFPHLEQTIAPEELEKIGAALDQTHGSGSSDNFQDEFWL